MAIHAPARRSDERNHHAHLLMTTRRLNADGLTEKTRELDDLKTGEVTRWRERWATLVNERLAEHGHTDRVDHRSLEAQGLDRDATFHKGPAVTAIERRGESAHVAERVRDDLTERLQNAAELGRLERESHELARSIIDTTTQLEAALAERDAERIRSSEEIRRDAQVAWLASRFAHAGTVPQPPQTARTLDLSGDVASARREAREQWLAHRQDAQPPGPRPCTRPRMVSRRRDSFSPMTILRSEQAPLQSARRNHRPRVDSRRGPCQSEVTFGVGRARRRTVGPPSACDPESRSRRNGHAAHELQPTQQRVTKVQSNIAKVLDDLDDEQQSCGAQGCHGKADTN